MWLSEIIVICTLHVCGAQVRLEDFNEDCHVFSYDAVGTDVYCDCKKHGASKTSVGTLRKYHAENTVVARLVEDSSCLLYAVVHCSVHKRLTFILS
jgi:hypothetical protein